MTPHLNASHVQRAAVSQSSIGANVASGSETAWTIKNKRFEAKSGGRAEQRERSVEQAAVGERRNAALIDDNEIDDQRWICDRRNMHARTFATTRFAAVKVVRSRVVTGVRLTNGRRTILAARVIRAGLSFSRDRAARGFRSHLVRHAMRKLSDDEAPEEKQSDG